MSNPPIKVFLVEDSPIALTIIKGLLSSSPDIKVVGTASGGKEALAAIPKLDPDVICTDLYMKGGMDGLELTKQIMSDYPRPILVVSVAVRPEDSRTTQELFKAGAVDVWPKPASGLQADYDRAKLSLITKIKVLSGVKVFTKTATIKANERREILTNIAARPQVLPSKMGKKGHYKIVAVGASTGGPQAVSSVIAQFPRDFPLPILCTQHISEGFLQGLVDCMKNEWQLKVKISERGEIPQPGIVYYAPEKHHLGLDSSGRFSFGSGSKSDLHCPSVDKMFASVASFYGKSAIGILLTGMGRDGAEGMLDMVNVGGLTVAQNEETSVVFGMPKEAIDLGAAKHVLPLQDIASFILSQV